MAALVLYTALADLEAWSAIASWPVPAGRNLPLDPASPFTAALLAAGKIELAPDGATDTATPASVVRGMPGLHRAVSN
jgi:hypothetical protein